MGALSLILTPRQLGTGDPAGQALENIVVTPLQDGAMCYVMSGLAQGEWRLDKSSVAVADGTSVIAPIGGLGRWLRLEAPPIRGIYTVDLNSAGPFAPLGISEVGPPWAIVDGNRINLPPGWYQIYMAALQVAVGGANREVYLNTSSGNLEGVILPAGYSSPKVTWLVPSVRILADGFVRVGLDDGAVPAAATELTIVRIAGPASN